MTYYYSLTRTLDTGLGDGYSTTVSISDRDAVNCAHMVANGFNTMSRNFTVGWVLGVVHPETGEVQYDGKVERLYRPETVGPDEWPANLFFSKTFNFEGSPLGESLITFFGDSDETTYIVRGDVKADGPPEHARPARSVLIDAYAELQAVKEVLADAGVETIPADRGVKDLRHALRARDAEIAELVQERANEAAEIGELQSPLSESFMMFNAANAAARAELIEYVKGERAKWLAADKQAPVNHEHMRAWFRGVLDVLAKFLVVTGEADASEGHAVARRLCEVPDGEV